MGDNEVLKDAIEAIIKENGAQEITGEVLQGALLSVINQFGAGAIFKGFAVPSTNPGTPDQNVFYMAVQEGTYTNFSGYVLEGSKIVVFENSTGSFVGSEIDISVPGNKIETWIAQDYESGSQVNYSGMDWVADSDTLDTDIPGVSDKWIQRLNVYTKVQIDNITGVENIKNYPKDFSTITNLAGGAGNLWANNIPLEKMGKLNSIRVKSPVGSTITAYVYSITGVSGSLVYEKLHTFQQFSTTSLEHNELINDDFVIESGKFVAYESSLGIYYSLSGLGYNIGNPTIASQTYAMDFTINENLSYGINQKIEDLENIVLNQKTYLKPSILYKNILSSLTGLTYVNWSLSGSNGVEPNGVGSGNYLWLNKNYQVNPRTMSVNVKLLSNSVFYIETVPVGFAQNNGGFIVDVPNNRISISNVSSGVFTEKTFGIVSFSFVSGRNYVIDLTILNFKNTMSIKDCVTSEVFEIVYFPSSTLSPYDTTQSDSYKFYLNSGTTSGVKINSITISSKKNPLVLLMGDSISSSVLFPTYAADKTYCKLLESRLKGSVLISAKGGATWLDVSQKLETELAFIKPDYCMLTIGTNGGLTELNLTTIVNRIIELGSIPIINHIANGGILLDHKPVNNIIDSVCLSTGAIRGCLFDVATSIGGNPNNSIVTSYYFGDQIHPNILGHEKMYDRFEIDLPFLLD